MAKSRSEVVRNVNTVMTYTYYHIGEMIVNEEQAGSQRAAYTETIVKDLSQALTREYGKGYSHRNLDYFKRFYLLYQEQITQSLIAQSDTYKNIPQSLIAFSGLFKLSSTHYIQLMKIADPGEREFYEQQSVTNNWSVRELQRQYNSSLFERLALSRDKKCVPDGAETGQTSEEPIRALKSPFVLEFLGLKEDSGYSENDLETAIINKLEHFMLELGKGFLFEGRQRRITLPGRQFSSMRTMVWSERFYSFKSFQKL
nr:PDDEXK nuclease domain-containing protein [Mucilaginibacter sp. NFR10]